MENIRQHLECPVCMVVAPDVKYFLCPNGHNICGNCQPHMAGLCPLCKSEFHCPPTRNILAEDLIALDPAMILPCKNYMNGCEFEGPRKDRQRHQLEKCALIRVHCPQPCCPVSLLANQVKEHVASWHVYTVQKLSDDNTLEVNTYFKVFNGQAVGWRLHMFQQDSFNFYLCRRICEDRIYIYVVVNAPEEVAARYEALLRFKGKDAITTWKMPVFSLCKDPRHIFSEHLESRFEISMQMLSEHWTHEIQNAHKMLGYGHLLKTEVTLIKKDWN